MVGGGIKIVDGRVNIELIGSMAGMYYCRLGPLLCSETVRKEQCYH